MYKGDFTPSKTVSIRFNTHKADGTPITLLGTPAISIYKGSTTESTAGVTLTIDYDARTGLNYVVIDTSADGTFYAAGNDFDVVITTGTVDSISVVGTKVGSFSLSNRSALRPATADRTITLNASGQIDLGAINGSATDGNNAVLYLKQLNLVNNNDDAIFVRGTGIGNALHLISDSQVAIMAETSSVGSPAVWFAGNGAQAFYLSNNSLNDSTLYAINVNASGKAIDIDGLIEFADELTVNSVALSAILTQITNKLGAFLGVSPNDVRGWLRAIMRSDVAVPSDIGGTYDPATASLQFIASGSGGSGTDPLLNQVPGIYASGTAGAALGRIGSGRITTVSPVAQGGDLTLVQGDAYTTALSRALEWTDVDAAWPDLTEASITLEVADGQMIVAGQVITATGASKKVRVQPLSSDTIALSEGIYPFNIVATFLGTGTGIGHTDRVTLVTGICTVTDREDA